MSDPLPDPSSFEKAFEEIEGAPLYDRPMFNLGDADDGPWADESLRQAHLPPPNQFEIDKHKSPETTEASETTKAAEPLVLNVRTPLIERDLG